MVSRHSDAVKHQNSPHTRHPISNMHTVHFSEVLVCAVQLKTTTYCKFLSKMLLKHLAKEHESYHTLYT